MTNIIIYISSHQKQILTEHQTHHLFCTTWKTLVCKQIIKYHSLVQITHSTTNMQIRPQTCIYNWKKKLKQNRGENKTNLYLYTTKDEKTCFSAKRSR